MPKSYTEKERRHLIELLQEAAFESVRQNGIKKTTVDDLVKKVNIPKGTFYLFYKSKELLLFDAIMKKEEALHQEMAERLIKLQADFSVATLTDLFSDFFQLGFEMGILPIILSGELGILIRKLPDDLVAESISKDDDFLMMLKHLFPQMHEQDIKTYSSAFRALFLTAMYKREIGDYDDALKLLIRGLVIQMLEETND
ncbi:TetR/AcrR family transcriptional regulator [Eubacteriaceae bacterium ES2]|nr:TetR/AcrR family transcriptional regulator [Eubacteriaceae bacterium ES2]